MVTTIIDGKQNKINQVVSKGSYFYACTTLLQTKKTEFRIRLNGFKIRYQMLAHQFVALVIIALPLDAWADGRRKGTAVQNTMSCIP